MFRSRAEGLFAEQTPAADSAAKAKALKSFQAKLLKPSASGEPPLPGCVVDPFVFLSPPCQILVLLLLLQLRKGWVVSIVCLHRLKEILEFSRLFKDDFVLNKMDLQTLQVGNLSPYFYALNEAERVDPAVSFVAPVLGSPKPQAAEQATLRDIF